MIVTLMILTAASLYAWKHGGNVWQACVCDRTVDETEDLAATAEEKEH